MTQFVKDFNKAEDKIQWLTEHTDFEKGTLCGRQLYKFWYRQMYREDGPVFCICFCDDNGHLDNKTFAFLTEVYEDSSFDIISCAWRFYGKDIPMDLWEPIAEYARKVSEHLEVSEVYLDKFHHIMETEDKGILNWLKRTTDLEKGTVANFLKIVSREEFVKNKRSIVNGAEPDYVPKTDFDYVIVNLREHTNGGSNVCTLDGKRMFYSDCYPLYKERTLEKAYSDWLTNEFGSKFKIENGVLTGVVDENIEVAVIPNSVKVIGKEAFLKCTSLKYVEIPNSVEVIGEFAFAGCTSLSEIDIPNSITSIGECAFSCSSLKSVEIPNSVEVIGDYAFISCTSLERAVISAKNIGYRAFFKCKSLESVVMPDCVEKIGERAFEMCDSLKSVSFPNSLKVIEKSAFECRKNLESVDFAFASLDLIGEYAFRGCVKLEGLKVVAKEVRECAFSNTGIKDLQLVSNSVDESAFSNCHNLERAKVHTEYLGFGAFEYCDNIKSVELIGVNKEYCSGFDENGYYIDGGYMIVRGMDIIRYAFRESNVAYIENLSKDPNQVDNVIVYGDVA